MKRMKSEQEIRWVYTHTVRNGAKSVRVYKAQTKFNGKWYDRDWKQVIPEPRVKTVFGAK